MSPNIKNGLELLFSGLFILICAVWPYQAMVGEKDWFPYGVIGLIAMLWWMQVFAKRWRDV